MTSLVTRHRLIVSRTAHYLLNIELNYNPLGDYHTTLNNLKAVHGNDPAAWEDDILPSDPELVSEELRCVDGYELGFERSRRTPLPPIRLPHVEALQRAIDVMAAIGLVQDANHLRQVVTVVKQRIQEDSL